VKPAAVSVVLVVLLGTGRAGADDPAPPPPPVTRPAAPLVRENQFSLKVALGGDYRSLYGIPIYGGDAHVSLGPQMGGRFAAYGTAGITFASTRYGLGTTIIELGGSVERRFDRLALGVLVQPTYLRVNRITTSGAFDSVGVGAAPFLSVDILSSEGHSLFVAASVSIDEYISGSTSFMWGPTLRIGYREED